MRIRLPHSSIAEDRTDNERVPVRIVVVSIVGLWLCYLVLTTVRGSIIGLPIENELLARRAFVCVVGALVTFALWLVLRLVDYRSLWLKIVVALIAALPASLVIAQSNQ